MLTENGAMFERLTETCQHWAIAEQQSLNAAHQRAIVRINPPLFDRFSRCSTAPIDCCAVFWSAAKQWSRPSKFLPNLPTNVHCRPALHLCRSVSVVVVKHRGMLLFVTDLLISTLDCYRFSPRSMELSGRDSIILGMSPFYVDCTVVNPRTSKSVTSIG